MASAKILLIDDDLEFADVLSKTLVDEGYEVSTLGRGKEALSKAASWRPDLILVDYKLPDIDGFEICRQLKLAEGTRSIPLIMITGRNSESDTVTALELGAEDFISKPFSTKVLIAKLRVNLRRKGQTPPNASELIDSLPDQIQIHSILVDRKKYRVFVDNQEVKLTTTQFKLLECLSSRPGFVFSREQIVKALNDQEYSITQDSIDVHIAGLRKKLGPAAGLWVETLRGIGYRMKEDSPSAG
jgi:DNA-binding response OmpR family regulator